MAGDFARTAKLVRFRAAALRQVVATDVHKNTLADIDGGKIGLATETKVGLLKESDALRTLAEGGPGETK